MKDMQDYKLNLIDNTIGAKALGVEESVNDLLIRNEIHDRNVYAAKRVMLSFANIASDVLSPEAKDLRLQAYQILSNYIDRHENPPSTPDPKIILNARIKELEENEIELNTQIAELKAKIEKPKAKKRRK